MKSHDGKLISKSEIFLFYPKKKIKNKIKTKIKTLPAVFQGEK